MDASLEVFIERLPRQLQSRLVKRESAFLPPGEELIVGLQLAEDMFLKETPLPAYASTRVLRLHSPPLRCWLATDKSLDHLAELARTAPELDWPVFGDLRRLLESQDYWMISFQPEWEDIDDEGPKDPLQAVEALKHSLCLSRPTGFLYHARCSIGVPEK